MNKLYTNAEILELRRKNNEVFGGISFSKESLSGMPAPSVEKRHQASKLASAAFSAVLKSGALRMTKS